VFLTASDKHDSPVTPDRSELGVSVDKQPAQVTTLRAAKNDPLLFAVLVDTSRSGVADAALIKKAALQLFRGLSTDGNHGYLVLFNVSVATSRQPLQVSQAESAVDDAKFGGGTAIYDAIEQTCIQALSRSGNPDTPRRVILLISDGEDNLSHVTRMAAEETAEKEGVAVFSLITDPLPLSPSPQGLRLGQGDHVLKEVSQETGGLAVSVRDSTHAVATLLAAVENQWALSFVLAQSPDEKLHSLAIRTSKKDIRISAPAHVFVH